MRKIRFFVFGLVIITTLNISCNNEKTQVVKTIKQTTADGAIILADSLVYGIATHASENEDLSESEEFKSFLQGKLIDYVFEQLYTGKIKAYDFFTDKELTIKDVKKLEKTKGFNRSKVGKVQFNEQWYFDNNGVLNKRVNSMTFGIEHYSDQGTFLNYNALFKIKF